MGFFGESVVFNVVFKLRQLWVSLANRWILTRWFELRQLWVAFENLSFLTRGFKLRLRRVAFENLPPLTQCFVSFEATFVPV